MATFKTRHPEFTGVPTALCQSVLDAAAVEINATLWGDLATEGHGFLTAHKLAISPFGNTAKLAQGADSTYERQYQRLRGIVTIGLRST